VVKKTDTATKITIIGLFAHYSYAVLLFLTSDLTNDLTFPMSILYLATTAIPLILVCYAALGYRGSSSLKDFEPRQSQEEA
jgi:hypothetical protein